MAHLDGADRDDLYRLSALFLAEKSIEPVGCADELDDERQLRLAALACLPILRLGLDWYDGFHSVVLYPAGFFPEREVIDEFGVTHVLRQELQGEAWAQGPVILSLLDLEANEPDTNLVIHEFAHKLDMESGFANGMPQLHADMRPEAWARAFSTAYEDLCARVDAETPTEVDPYAATDPAEFFAVTSEHFFEAPDLLQTSYPEVYAQLAQFYRQDPRQR
jgi:Mlc titration factor MtfA (ptsG expression regulator)